MKNEVSELNVIFPGGKYKFSECNLTRNLMQNRIWITVCRSMSNKIKATTITKTKIRSTEKRPYKGIITKLWLMRSLPLLYRFEPKQ